MSIKQRMAARFDRRYARITEVQRLTRALGALETRCAGDGAVLAPRLDALQSRVAVLEARLVELAGMSSVLGTIQDALSAGQLGATATQGELAAKQGDLTRQATELAREVREAKRLATEAAISIGALMETEVRHRQLLDALSGDGA